MRQSYLILILITIFLFCIGNVNAVACINLNLAKTIYLPKETVQVEIDADIMRDILVGDVFFYRGTTKLPIGIFISKVTETKYFLWFDLPAEPGDYMLRVRGTCKDGSFYVASIPIKVKKIIASRYSFLRTRAENRWLSLVLEEHVLLAGALSHILADEALVAYRERNDSCINQNCSTKLNALTLIAFEDGLVRQKMQDALEASQNTSGCWDITRCNTEATAYALLSLAITGRLDMNNSAHVNGTSWLAENAFSIEEKAVSYYLTKNPEILTQLLNTQAAEGWWSKNITSHEPDIKATALAIFALKDSNNSSVTEAVEKARGWLLDREGLSLDEEAFMFVFAFSFEDIEPLLALWPGLVKTESSGSFDLILLNKGITDIILNAELLNSTIPVNLSVDSMKNVRFNIPQITTTDGRTISENLILDYRSGISKDHYEYSVPVLIFTKKAAQEGINGTINASEEEVNETKQQEIINETKEWENKTTELNESLIQKKFYFIEKNITKSADLSEGPFTITVRLENKLDRYINDISITYSSSFIGLVERIDPSYIEKISGGQRETITIYITPTIARTYDGEIIASARYDTEKITTSLPMTINITRMPAEEKNCSELGGKICKEKDEFCDETVGNITVAADTFSCCIPAEACKKKPTPGKTAGIIIVVVVLVMLLIIYLLLRRKPKKEMKEFLEERAKQYEKKFQRPSSIK